MNDATNILVALSVLGTANDTAGPPAPAPARAAWEAKLAEEAKKRWTGAKYVTGRDLREVAKLVRADIKAAIAAGDLPAGLTVAVRLERYSMGQTLRVVILTAPGVTVPSVLWVRQDAGLTATDRHGKLAPWMSPEAKRVLAAVEAIANAYNFDHSHGGGGAGNQAFHLDVSWSGELVTAQRTSIRVLLLRVYPCTP